MQYEWDKNTQNIMKHGFDFVDVQSFDWDEALFLKTYATIILNLALLHMAISRNALPLWFTPCVEIMYVLLAYEKPIKERRINMDTKTNWARIDAMTDEDIARAVASDSDAAPLEAEGLRRINVGGRPRKVITKQITTVRLSPDVIQFFKAENDDGKGWQTRLNHVLEEYVKEHKAG